MSRDKIINLEKELKDKGLLDEPLVKQLLDNYKEKSKTKYGLVWEDKSEQVHADLKTGISNVTEYIDKRIIKDKSKPQKLLIEGDNLHGLMLLKEEGVKVDVIYIDPPYNTGSEFVYDDNIVDHEDGYRHSKWLSFMGKRLELAYDLLSEDGVIFVSIDDNEQANLKLLMDKIFGESNVDIAVWNKIGDGNASAGKMKIVKRLRRDHEYIIIAYKNKHLVNFDKILEIPNFKNDYTNPDNDPRGPYKGGNISKTEAKSLPEGKNFYQIITPSGRIINRQWHFDKAEFDRLDKDNRIYWGKDGSNIPAIKIFTNEPRKIEPSSIFIEKGSASMGSSELRDIFGNIPFDNPKPIKLILHLLSLLDKGSSYNVLDFFAGSGTTAQAIMELNEEDGGNRQFILMTNNEVSINDMLELAIDDVETEQLLDDNGISLKPHKGTGSVAKNKKREKDIEKFFNYGDGKEFFNSDIVQDEGICRKVTYERIRRVIEGDYVSGPVEPLPNNLSYYKLDVEQDYDFEDEYLYRMRQSLLGLIVKEGQAPIQIDEYTFVFDRGENEALVYDAGLYTKQSVIDYIREQFEDYNFEVISENNNADIKWKNLRKGVI